MGNGPLNAQIGTYGNAVVKLSVPDMTVSVSCFGCHAYDPYRTSCHVQIAMYMRAQTASLVGMLDPSHWFPGA